LMDDVKCASWWSRLGRGKHRGVVLPGQLSDIIIGAGPDTRPKTTSPSRNTHSSPLCDRACDAPEVDPTTGRPPPSTMAPPAIYVPPTCRSPYPANRVAHNERAGTNDATKPSDRMAWRVRGEWLLSAFTRARSPVGLERSMFLREVGGKDTTKLASLDMAVRLGRLGFSRWQVEGVRVCCLVWMGGESRTRASKDGCHTTEDNPQRRHRRFDGRTTTRLESSWRVSECQLCSCVVCLVRVRSAPRMCARAPIGGLPA
jgi:hypothetical protein